jgi:hypothetical protein
VKALKAVNEHGAVDFIEDVATNLDRIVGRNSHQVRIKRRMMKTTHRNSIRDCRYTADLSITDYVSRIEQRLSLQAANRALSVISAEHALAKFALV